MNSDNCLVLAMKATDSGRTMRILLPVFSNFNLINLLAETYQNHYNRSAIHDQETNTLYMELSELHMFDILTIVQTYAGEVITPAEIPDEELYNLITQA